MTYKSCFFHAFNEDGFGLDSWRRDEPNCLLIANTIIKLLVHYHFSRRKVFDDFKTEIRKLTAVCSINPAVAFNLTEKSASFRNKTMITTSIHWLARLSAKNLSNWFTQEIGKLTIVVLILINTVFISPQSFPFITDTENFHSPLSHYLLISVLRVSFYLNWSCFSAGPTRRLFA